MSDVPDELDGFIDEIVSRVSSEVSDAVFDDLIDDLTSELPPQVVQALREDELEPLTPEDGINKFTNKKEKSVDESTWSSYESKYEYMEEYFLEVLDLQNLNDLTPEQSDGYEDWREKDSLDRDEPLAGKTLKDDMHLFKECLGYLVKIRAVPADAYDIVEIPELENGEGVDKETLDPERAEAILEYLGRFRYASCEHVTLLLLIKTGRRPCDLVALDLKDFDDDGDEVTLSFVHRPESGTELKEDEKHEATIKLADDVGEVIRHYIDNKHPHVADDNARAPLLGTQKGRISKSTIREYANKWTRPCKIGRECPYGRDPETCEAAQSAKKATGCEGTRAPRQIRSGYITAKLNAKASYESVGHRVGATKKVLKRHYDHPSEDEERERYQDEILNGNEGAGGFQNE